MKKLNALAFALIMAASGNVFAQEAPAPVEAAGGAGGSAAAGAGVGGMSTMAIVGTIAAVAAVAAIATNDNVTAATTTATVTQ